MFEVSLYPIARDRPTSGTDRPPSGRMRPLQGRQARLRTDRLGPPGDSLLPLGVRVCGKEREFFTDNRLVRNHFIIVMIRWTGLASWELEFPFPGSLTSTFPIGRLWHTFDAPNHF